MEKGLIGVSDVSRKIKKGYICINNEWHKIIKGYLGVNNVSERVLLDLPDAYQQVEYITVQGGAEINTGLCHGDLDEIYASIKKDWSNYGALFGNHVNEASECTRWIYYNDESSNNCITTFNSKSGGGGITINNCMHYDEFNEVHMTINENLLQRSTIRGASKARAHIAGDENNTPIVLGKSKHSTGGSSLQASIKYFIAKKNGKEVMNLVPCYRKSDNEAGMYDVANDVFYTNPVECQGTIVAGSDV